MSPKSFLVGSYKENSPSQLSFSYRRRARNCWQLLVPEISSSVAVGGCIIARCSENCMENYPMQLSLIDGVERLMDA